MFSKVKNFKNIFSPILEIINGGKYFLWKNNFKTRFLTSFFSNMENNCIIFFDVLDFF